jgi:hypothetical protein
MRFRDCVVAVVIGLNPIVDETSPPWPLPASDPRAVYRSVPTRRRAMARNRAVHLEERVDGIATIINAGARDAAVGTRQKLPDFAGNEAAWD